jgi:hypothetical protein
MVTAKEFLKNYLKHNPDCKYDDVMIEFAKFHVEKALKKACEEVDFTSETYRSIQQGSHFEVDKESIINAYPLENIK